MSPLLVRAALGAMVAMALLGAPVEAQSAAPSPAASPVPPTSGLEMAVPFAALGTTSILYSDWAAMKATQGAADITSATPIDVRMTAMQQLIRSEAPFAAFALAHFRGHADAWGWDTSDLEWEASLQGDGPPVAVLRFRHGFDLDGVAAHLDARGFSTTDYGDAVIRSHDLATAGSWVATTNFGILNTAFLDDGQTLVLSSSVDALKAALDARNVMTYRAEPAVVVAGALSDPLSAGIEIGSDACHAFDPQGLPGDDGRNDALIAAVGPLRAWQAMGIGTHRRAAEEPSSGRIAFAYGSQTDAAADLPGRLRLGREGVSLRTDEPYRNAVFSVSGGSTESDMLAIDVTPAGDMPARLQSAWFARDLLLASCS